MQVGSARTRRHRRSSAAPRLRFSELDASRAGLDELSRFYRSFYVPAFPDPDERESLSNMKRYLKLKQRGSYGRNSYHILLARRDGDVVGGSVSDYLARPNAGVIEYLFVVPGFRGQGIGQALFRRTQRVLRADAERRTGRPLTALVTEMNDPFRRPSMPDNFDPFERAAIWGGWGFCKLEFPYLQPALSRGQDPVTGLILAAKPMSAAQRTGVQAPWVRQVVGEYMRWAMRIPRPVRHREFQAMAHWLSPRRLVALTPLHAYIGRDPTRPFDVLEVRTRAAEFRAAVGLIQQEIKGEGRVASTSQFARALSLGAGRAPCYHLWALRAPGTSRIDGAASFFTLPTIGYGGYLVLAGRLRGRGLLRQVIARIEEQMLRDRSSAQGWFIETGPESRAIFVHCGFQEIDVDYRPPAVGRPARAQRDHPERLHLLYKPFGSVHTPIAVPRAELLDGVAEVLDHVYGVNAPRRHECYARVAHPPGEPAPIPWTPHIPAQ